MPKTNKGKKQCTACKKVKGISEFYRNSYAPDGFCWRCKKCTVKYNERLTAQNIEKRKSRKAVKKKMCNRCKKIRKASEFNTNNRRPDGLGTECKACESRRHKRHRVNMTEKEKQHQNRKEVCWKRGITPKDFERMLKEQSGQCAICGRYQIKLNRCLCVDHNHKTDEVRSLLCYNCNAILGQANDDKCILAKAIKYLEKYE